MNKAMRDFGSGRPMNAVLGVKGWLVQSAADGWDRPVEERRGSDIRFLQRWVLGLRMGMVMEWSPGSLPTGYISG